MFNMQGLNAGDWLGVFGQSNSEPRNTKNAPANDAFQFPTIGMPRLDRESQFQQELRENQLTAQQALQNTRAGAEQLSSLTGDNYQRKVNTDLWADQQRSLMQNSGFRTTPVALGSAQSPFGRWGAPTQRATVGYGDNQAFNKFSRDSASEGLDFATQSARRISEAEAAGDIAKIRAQSQANNAESFERARQEADKMRMQQAFDSQSSRSNYFRQAAESAKQRVSQERLAQIQANANIYGSMFGALSSPGANTRYWS